MMAVIQMQSAIGDVKAFRANAVERGANVIVRQLSGTPAITYASSEAFLELAEQINGATVRTFMDPELKGYLDRLRQDLIAHAERLNQERRILVKDLYH